MSARPRDADRSSLSQKHRSHRSARGRAAETQTQRPRSDAAPDLRAATARTFAINYQGVRAYADSDGTRLAGTRPAPRDATRLAASSGS